MEELQKIETKAHERRNTGRNTEEQSTITFPIFYFKEINAFKKIIHDAKNDLQQTIGDTKIIMAVKKNPSIGNSVIQNKQLSSNEKARTTQRCQASNCLQCPLVNTKDEITVNNKGVKPSKTLNCRSISSTSGNVRFATPKTATSVGRSRKPTKEPTPTDVVSQRKSGRIPPFQCIPEQFTKKILTSQTLE